VVEHFPCEPEHVRQLVLTAPVLQIFFFFLEPAGITALNDSFAVLGVPPTPIKNHHNKSTERIPHSSTGASMGEHEHGPCPSTLLYVLRSRPLQAKFNVAQNPPFLSL